MPAPKTQRNQSDEQARKHAEPEGTELKYEEGIAQLEALIESMEEGELSKLTLEDTLAAYERGILLHARLEALLKRGEKRVQMLAVHGGEADLDADRIPFEGGFESVASQRDDGEE